MARTFYLIDGHAQIYRAYFAPFRELSSPAGEPTKATFIFTQTLLNLLEQRRPDYLAMAIDSGDADVFRTRIDPQYKANREPPPPDFLPQEQRILRLVRDSGIPVFGLSGFEADDLLATMARRLAALDFDVFLVSRDKDLRQILGPRVRMYDAGSGDVLDAEGMQRDLGYAPQQAIDVQTLMGDSIDNVPGVPGVGEKTAAQLIAQFGSIEGIYAGLDQIRSKKKLVENLLSARDRLPITRQLVTLRDDVPLEFDPQACSIAGLRLDAVQRHLEELGFRGLVSRVRDMRQASPRTPTAPAMPDSLFASPDAAPPPVVHATSADAEYVCVDTPEKLEAFLRELREQRRFAFDTETDALGAMRSGLVGMSFAWRSGRAHYLPLQAPEGAPRLPLGPTIDALRPILEDPAVAKVGHNLKYDLLAMRCAGVRVRGVALDSMVAAFVLDAGRMQYGIDRLAIDLLNFRKIPTEDLIGKGVRQRSMAGVDLPLITRYAAEDADIAWRLAERFDAELSDNASLRRLHDEVETPLIDVLAEMEFTGVAVDPAVLAEQSAALGQRIGALRESVFREAGAEFNLDSPRQLGEILFDRLGLKTVKRTKTGFSTDVEVLERLAAEHPVPRLLLEYRGLVKLKNTYLDNLTDFVNPRTGRIHASFNQTGAATGRLSCSDPNLQNIPIRTDEGRRIRMAFVPQDRARDVLLTADYSQIELRVLAHFTQEPALLQAFEREQDIHRAVAAEVFGVDPAAVTPEQRGQAKVVNFGIIYGVSPFGLARRIDGLTVQSATDLIDAYHRRFPAIRGFLDQCVEQARARGHVETVLGRRRPIRDIDSRVLSVRNAAERVAINSVVQGSAADLIKVAMVNIHRRLQRDGSPSRLLLQVHDELVFETPEASVEQEARWIEQEMTGALALRVPLRVESGWGRNWREGK